MERNQVLLLYENTYNFAYIKDYLTTKGYILNIAGSFNDAVKMVGSIPIELFLTDYDFANDPSSADYQRIKLINPVILLLRVQVQSTIPESPGDFEFFKRMLSTLDVLENTLSIYRYKSN